MIDDLSPARPEQESDQEAAAADADKLPTAALLPLKPLALPGRPCDTFAARLNQHQRAHSPWSDWLALALGAAVTLRCAHAFAAHLNQVWLLIYCAGASAAILRERAAPPSYARWRERLAAGTGLLCFGLGLACTHPRLILDSYTGAAVLDFAHHALLLLFSSGAVAICALACSWRVRFSVWLAVWLAVAATNAPYARHVCASAALRHPAAQPATSHLYSLGSLVFGCGVPLQLAAFVQPDALGKCSTLLVALHFGLGAVAPLLAVALGEARAFQQHQLQRWQAQLPLERGVQAAVYDWLWEVTLGGSGPHTALVYYPLLAACWNFSIFCAVWIDGAPAEAPAQTAASSSS